MKAFYACKIALEGFTDLEKLGMVNLITENGGQYVDTSDPDATHIVRLIFLRLGHRLFSLFILTIFL